MASNSYDLSVILRVLDKASAPLRNISSKFHQLTRPVDAVNTRMKALGESVKKVGTQMSSLGRSMSLKMTLPITAFGALSLKASMDFNEGMANVATLIPGNIKRVEELKKAVQDMAIRTGKSTDIMAEGLYQVISAFGDTADTTEMLEINAKAATAGVASVSDAVNLTSVIMKGYGDVSKEAAEKAANLAFQTVKLGQTTFPELAASIGRVTPLAAQLNVKQEELFSVFATLTGVTGGAAEVSTQFAGALEALFKPTETMKRALEYLKETGVISEATGKALLDKKGVVGAFQVLNELAGGNEEILTQMFGRREPLVAIFALLGPQADTYKEKLVKMYKVIESMNEAFDEQTKGINKAGFIWKQFKIQVTRLRQEFGDALSPALMKILAPLKRFVTWMAGLSNRTKIVIIVIGALIAIIGPLLIMLGSIAGVLALVTIAGLPLILTIAAIGLAIGALIGIIAVIIIYWKEFSAFIRKWGTVMILVLGLIMSPVSALVAGFALIAAAAFAIIKNWGPIKSFFMNLFSFINEKIQKTIRLFKEMLPDWLKKKMGFSIAMLEGANSSIASSTGKAVAAIGAQKSETDINIKVTSDAGSTATIEKVKKKRGDANVSTASLGYVGAF